MSDDELAKPFLRWAGGKSWLVKEIKDLSTQIKYNNYHEPFLGGGAVFFALSPLGEAFLSDSNKELINAYIIVRDHLDSLLPVLDTYVNSKEFYYGIRKKNFRCKIDRAARFIYLNATSFNGLYRVNLKGVYNVPYGFRTTPIYNKENIKRVSLSLQKSKLRSEDFKTTLDYVQQGDLVFLDPPYTTSHNSNGFIKYNKKLFSLEDQYRLNDFIGEVKKKRAYYIMTNAANEKIDEIFTNCDKKIETIRSSAIGGKKARRGKVKEYLFTNIGG